MLVTIGAAVALAFAIAGSSSAEVPSTINDFAWVCIVLSSFPRAMLIMSVSFGLWRAGLVSSRFFTAAVGAVVLVLLGGTTWMSSGVWTPDGIYTRLISPLFGLIWVIAIRMLLSRPIGRAGW